jgi:hypothetical protein
MQKHYNDQIDTFVQTFKEDIKKNFVNDQIKFCKFIDSYDTFQIESSVTKNNVISDTRCIARRSNNEQCTRRHNSSSLFCGTHIKSNPFGYIGVNIPEKKVVYDVTIHTQEIQGIVYYIDDNDNVYSIEDIFNNIVNPTIIGKVQCINGKYIIPEINLL